MAKVIEEIVVIKLTTIVKDTEEHKPSLNNENIDTINQVVDSLVEGKTTLVEVERA